MSASYDYLAMQTQANEPNTKYFGFSVMIHTIMALGSLYLTVPLLENIKKEEIIIEILEPEIAPPIVKSLAAPKGEVLEKTKGLAKSTALMPSAPVDSEIAEVVKGPVAKSVKSKNTEVAKLKTFTGSGLAIVATAAPSRAGVPETIEDIAAPDLDFDGVVAAQDGNLGDDAFENEFKNIDQSNAAALRAEKSVLDNEAKLIADKQDEALQALENDNQARARAMEDSLNATRTKNAAALLQVKAAEQAAAEKAARDAALAKATAAGSGQAKAGKGSGDSGSEKASTGISGDPNSVRTLDQLRQIPGNPKPQYSNDERLRREQGSVAFHAYISKAGQPTKFRIMQSTGFRNLDGKTLAALKRWKFYPGQEGWVEIPMKWDLKGGVQEMPTLLRRYGSR